jgi:hypothetical protein
MLFIGWVGESFRDFLIFQLLGFRFLLLAKAKAKAKAKARARAGFWLGGLGVGWVSG